MPRDKAPLCACGCGEETRLVEKGDPKRGLVANNYRKYASHQCYLDYRKANKKTHCDYGHKLKIKLVKGKECRYCRECNTARRLALKSGMEVIDILAQDVTRERACEICGKVGKVVFDHNHETGEFRGWLCNRCNSGLGHFGDSPEIIRRAYRYLKVNGHYG